MGIFIRFFFLFSPTLGALYIFEAFKIFLLLSKPLMLIYSYYWCCCCCCYYCWCFDLFSLCCLLLTSIQSLFAERAFISHMFACVMQRKTHTSTYNKRICSWVHEMFLNWIIYKWVFNVVQHSFVLRCLNLMPQIFVCLFVFSSLYVVTRITTS